MLSRFYLFVTYLVLFISFWHKERDTCYLIDNICKKIKHLIEISIANICLIVANTIDYMLLLYHHIDKFE
jgi:hypothetical protein